MRMVSKVPIIWKQTVCARFVCGAQFQDVVGQDGFYLFGHHIADSGIKGSQLALAVSSLPNQMIGFAITLPAGHLLIYSSTPPFSYNT